MILKNKDFYKQGCIFDYITKANLFTNKIMPITKA